MEPRLLLAAVLLIAFVTAPPPVRGDDDDERGDGDMMPDAVFRFIMGKVDSARTNTGVSQNMCLDMGLKLVLPSIAEKCGGKMMSCGEDCPFGYQFNTTTRCPICKCAQDPCTLTKCAGGEICVTKKWPPKQMRNHTLVSFAVCRKDVVRPGTCTVKIVYQGLIQGGWTSSGCRENPGDDPQNECEKDAHCEGGGKCCDDGCQKKCSRPDRDPAMKPCLRVRSTLGHRAVRCCGNGDFEKKQCRMTRTGDHMCWCVNPATGVPLQHSTRFGMNDSMDLNCDNFNVPTCTPIVQSCSRACRHGLKYDVNGCVAAVCECNPDPCKNVTCAEGERCLLKGHPATAQCVQVVKPAERRPGGRMGQCQAGNPYNARKTQSCPQASDCTTDTDCPNDGQKCCRRPGSRCSNVCVDPLPSPEKCHSVRRMKLERILQVTSSACNVCLSNNFHVASCEPDGRFKPVQCEENTGMCWCVDPRTGDPKSGKIRGMPNCCNITALPPVGQGEVCPAGKPVFRCSSAACMYAKCPRHPGAVCRMDPCGGCRVKFFDPTTNREVQNCFGRGPCGQYKQERMDKHLTQMSYMRKKICDAELMLAKKIKKSDSDVLKMKKKMDDERRMMGKVREMASKKPGRGSGRRPDNDRTNEDRPDRPDGQRPDRPDGQRPDRPDGQRPDRPDGQGPDRPDGQRPDGTDGQRPDGPDGQRPDRPDGQRPDRTDGERPDRTDGRRPENDGKGRGDRDEDGDEDEEECKKSFFVAGRADDGEPDMLAMPMVGGGRQNDVSADRMMMMMVPPPQPPSEMAVRLLYAGLDEKDTRKGMMENMRRRKMGMKMKEMEKRMKGQGQGKGKPTPRKGVCGLSMMHSLKDLGKLMMNLDRMERGGNPDTSYMEEEEEDNEDVEGGEEAETTTDRCKPPQEKEREKKEKEKRKEKEKERSDMFDFSKLNATRLQTMWDLMCKKFDNVEKTMKMRQMKEDDDVDADDDDDKTDLVDQCPPGIDTQPGVCVIECETNAQCTDGKICCTNGCGGGVCVMPVPRTTVRRPYMPRCDVAGNYASRQCRGNLCWCVDPVGNLLSTTAYDKRLKCVTNGGVALDNKAQPVNSCADNKSPRMCKDSCTRKPYKGHPTCSVDLCNCTVSYQTKPGMPPAPMEHLCLMKPPPTCLVAGKAHQLDLFTGACVTNKTSSCPTTFKTLDVCNATCIGLQCPAGKRTCSENPCEGKKCPLMKGAFCIMNGCTCEANWFYKGRRIEYSECTDVQKLAGKSTCERCVDDTLERMKPFIDAGEITREDVVVPTCVRSKNGKFMRFGNGAQRMSVAPNEVVCVDQMRCEPKGSKSCKHERRGCPRAAMARLRKARSKLKFPGVFRNSMKAGCESEMRKVVQRKMKILATQIESLECSAGSIVVSMVLNEDENANVDLNTAMNSLQTQVESGTFTVDIDGQTFTADPEFFEIENTSDQSPQPEPESNTGLIIGLVVGGIIVVLLLGVFFYCMCKKTKPPPSDDANAHVNKAYEAKTDFSKI